MKIKYIKYFGFAVLLLIALKVYANSYTATVNNTTSLNLGTVTWNLNPSGTQDVNVSGSGEYPTTLSSGIVSITILGQTLAAGTNGNIYLSNNTPLPCVWSTDGSGNIIATVSDGY